jgi:hypothetical protein
MCTNRIDRILALIDSVLDEQAATPPAARRPQAVNDKQGLGLRTTSGSMP